ncbi:hypothetical protein PSTH68_21510 [Pseudomonas syringae pv. theae]|uniref:ATP-binding protein n=1 Tax=Pseudomonas syringae TaxID=317 RepID=UPI00235B4ADD|nr:ATP-binding protein [Pseudomonas syringae]MBL3872656.1 chromosome segregation protein SMC [Pseudomonas syringae pv. theae]GKQ32143.1 hypothetical protein PSTH68_21510 [Pseudomonas syringae pv. theae]
MKNIRKITLKNFKLFGPELYTINFEDTDLILLDGPNGYGKTSVFDAIELALTGNISRLINLEGRQTPSDVVVAFNNSAEVEVIIEIGGSAPKTIVRTLKKPPAKEARKISKFRELWDLFEISDGNLVSLTQTQLNIYLGNENFVRDYHLFHYVQQEESARFLKSKSEVQRAEELSKLFGDTKSAETKLSKLTAVSKRTDGLKLEAFKRTTTLKQRYDISNVSDLTERNSIEHRFLLPWLQGSAIPEWDKVSIPDLTQDKLNMFLVDLSQLKSFLYHRKDFLRERKYKRSALEKPLIRNYLKYLTSLNNIESYREENTRYRLIANSVPVLVTSNISSILDIPELQRVFEILNIPYFNSFYAASTELYKEEQKAVGLNQVYNSLIRDREALSKHIDGLPDENCPLCGHHYETHTDLVAEVSAHGAFLRTFLGEQEQTTLTLRDAFIKIHLSPLIISSNNYLENTSAPSDTEISELTSAMLSGERIKAFGSWLMSEGIVYDDLLQIRLPSVRTDTQLNDDIEKLSTRIRDKATITDDAYLEANSGNIFDMVYQRFFQSSAPNTGMISEAALDTKES